MAAATAIDTLLQAVFPSQRPWISYAQASEETSLSRSTLYRLQKAGQIESRKIGNRLLLSRESINAFLRTL